MPGILMGTRSVCLNSNPKILSAALRLGFAEGGA